LKRAMITVPVPEPGRCVMLVNDIETGVVVTNGIRRIAAFAKAFTEAWNFVSESMQGRVPEEDDKSEAAEKAREALVQAVEKSAAEQFLGLSEYVMEELYAGEDGPGQMVADIESLLQIGVKSPEQIGAKVTGAHITGGGRPRGN
jgi:hypothetical protein